MKYLLASALLLASITASIQAQEVAQVFCKQGEPACEDIYIDGVRLRFLTHEGVTVGLFMLDANGFYAAAVEVTNNSENRILVNPAHSRILILGDDNKQTYFPPTPPEKVASKIKGRHKWGNAFRSFAARMAQRRTTAISDETGDFSVYGSNGSASGTYRGNTTTVTSEPDREVQRRVAEGNARRNAVAADEAELAAQLALRANTVFPGKQVSGYIFFQHKDIKRGGFRILIGNTMYNFPVRFK